jgi:hypothetical protein
MNLLSRVFGPTTNGYAEQARLAARAWSELPPRELYALLESYYHSNHLYDSLASSRYEAGVWSPAAKELRNPANRIVDVYAAKLLGSTLEDALPIKAEKEQIIEPIQRVWHWSNFARRKQVFSRYSALFGTVFLKVVQPQGSERVFFQIIHPGRVSDFELDERDFVTYCRVDTPSKRREAGRIIRFIATEVWDAAAGTVRFYEHAKPLDTPLEQLGTPELRRLSEFGIDFVPFVLHKHRDVGEDRGLGAFTHALTKIDEANRMATRLHQLLFRHNKPVGAIESAGRDASGRPVPPPDLDGEDAGVVTLADEELWRMPGGWTYRTLVPDLKYAEALAILNAMMAELEDDCPELTYARIREIQDASGVALRYRLLMANDRILEARGNAHESIQRADMMALTMGKRAGLEGFAAIGEFDAGDYEHTFDSPDIIELDSLTEAQAELARAQAFTTATGQTLPSVEALQRVYGYPEERAVELVELMAEQTEAGTVAEQ